MSDLVPYELAEPFLDSGTMVQAKLVLEDEMNEDDEAKVGSIAG